MHISTTLKELFTGPNILIESEWLKGFNLLLEANKTKSEDELIKVIRNSYGITAIRPGYEEEGGKKYSAIHGNVGFIYLTGPIFPEPNFVTEYIGVGTALSEYQKELKALYENEDVESVNNIASSPGGNVLGVSETSDLINELKATHSKPFNTYVMGQNCSACYWISSASDKIYGNKMSMHGSIGVIASVRRKNKDDDFVEVVNTDSPNKIMDPDSEEGLKEIRKTLDAMASVFYETVAANRNVSVEKVKSDFGRGGVLMASEALKAGMIDEVKPYNEFLEDTGIKTENSFNEGESKMNLNELKEKHPEVFKQAVSELQTSLDALTAKHTELATVAAAAAAENAALQAKLDADAKASAAAVQRIEALEADNAKRAAMDKEKEITAKANAIFDSAFATTKLPDRIKTKVQKDHNSFVTDSGLDEEKYKASLAKEFEDWKAIVGTSNSTKSDYFMGSGQRTDNHQEDDAETDETVNALLAFINPEAAAK